MGVSRVDFDGETLIDLTGDSVTPQSLLNGYSAHNRAGELIEGLAVVPAKVSELENDSKFITETGDSSKTTVTFEQAVKKANVNSGDDLSTAFGKLSRFCEDLKPHAFSTPSSDLLTTIPGFSLDATMGKKLKDLHDANKNEIDAINSKLGNLTFNTSLAGVKWTKLPNGIILGYGNKVVISGSDKYLASFAGYHGVESIDVSDIPFKTFKRVFGHIEGGTSWPMYLKSDCSISGNALFLSIMTDNPNSGWNFHYFIVGV